MKQQNEDAVRPLAFQLARELNEKEVEAIAGASFPITYPPPGQNPEQGHWRDVHK